MSNQKIQIKLTLNSVNGGYFSCMPAREIALSPDRILCNNVILPWEFNPHAVRLWAIGNEYGAVCAVWAACEQDALDEMIDEGLGDSFLVEENTKEDTEYTYLGNAGEPCNLDHCWIQPVRLDEAKDCQLLCLFAKGESHCAENLDSLFLSIPRALISA